MSDIKRRRRPQERQVAESQLSPEFWRLVSYVCAFGFVTVLLTYLLLATGIVSEAVGDFPAPAALFFFLMWGVGGYASYQYAEKHSTEGNGIDAASATRGKTIVKYDPMEPANEAIKPALRVFVLCVAIWAISLAGVGGSPKKMEDFRTIALIMLAIASLALIWKVVVYLNYASGHRKFGVSTLRYERLPGDYDQDQLSFVFSNPRLHKTVDEVSFTLSFIKEEFVPGKYAPVIGVEKFDGIVLEIAGEEIAFSLDIPPGAVSDFDPTGAAYWELEAENEGVGYFAGFLLPLG